MLFLETKKFAKRVAVYLTDEAYADLQSELLIDPEKGDVIPDTGGARKIRIPLQGRGKRGGGRVVYFYKTTGNVILLLNLYPKNVQTDLNDSDRKEMRDEIRRLREGGYP